MNDAGVSLSNAYLKVVIQNERITSIYDKEERCVVYLGRSSPVIQTRAAGEESNGRLYALQRSDPWRRVKLDPYSMSPADAAAELGMSSSTTLRRPRRSHSATVESHFLTVLEDPSNALSTLGKHEALYGYHSMRSKHLRMPRPGACSDSTVTLTGTNDISC